MKSTFRKIKKITRSYNNINITLLESKNFIKDVKHKDIIIKVISIHKLNKLIENKQFINLLFNNNNILKVLICK